LKIWLWRRFKNMEGAAMHFIEQLLGFSPDGGTSMTEIAVLACVLAGILLVYARRIKLLPKRS
jgi:hypothetical protein